MLGWSFNPDFLTTRAWSLVTVNFHSNSLPPSSIAVIHSSIPHKAYNLPLTIVSISATSPALNSDLGSLNPDAMSDSESEHSGPENQRPGDQKEEKLQFRTVQQQEKYENLMKQKRREQGLETNRSRSASRRARRQRIKEGIESGKYMKTASLEALEEADASGELNQMQMFERIGPDSTSMEGPVTKARAMRGEIPLRGTDPNQPYRMPREAGKR